MMNLKVFKTQKYTVGYRYEIDVKRTKEVLNEPENNLETLERDIININKSRYTQYF